MEDTIEVIVASEKHLSYVETILDTIEKAAKVRGTGIAKRSPEYVKQKMLEGKAIIALDGDKFAGFCYIESWSNKQFVANSGLIVVEAYRGHGLAKRIKRKAFELSRSRFPDAKIFGLTTGLAVMKINSELGYRPVTFSELTDDEAFWKGCQGEKLHCHAGYHHWRDAKAVLTMTYCNGQTAECACVRECSSTRMPKNTILKINNYI